MDEYGINDIKSLSFKEGVRCRVQMYLGSDDIEGTYQAFKEIINNSTDEAIAGYGNRIEVEVSEKENSITVRDYGRGVPFGRREDGENVLVSIYSKSHTGGKFAEGAYKNSSGLNGIGAKCVCLSAQEFAVESYRDGRKAKAYFKQGEFVSYDEDDTNNKNGTWIRFIPDPNVFKNGNIGYTYSRICEELHSISYLYSGLTFYIKNNDTGETVSYCAKNGIADFVKDNIEKPLHKTIMYNSVSDDVDKVEIAFQWGNGKEAGYVFVNGLYCPEGGTPITGAKTAITRTFNSQSGQNFDGDSIRNGLVYVINCSVAQPSFANQTKTKINNQNLRTLASNAFSEAIKEMKEKRSNEFDVIVDLMKKITKAEAAAERARQSVLNGTKEIEKNQKRKVFASDKLKDAEFLGENSTLLIVEGNSAAASMAVARDTKKYGILGLRGKLINALSNSDEKLMQNEEIKLLLSAMNIMPNRYDSKKLRYGKIAICVDSDSDGYHIALLIMCALVKYAPQFIKEKRLYWLRSPLYIVTNGNKHEYYFNDAEFNARKSTHGEVTRAKGLGALNANTAKESMFGANQRMDLLEPDEDSFRVLIELMSDEVEFRRDFIMNKIDFSEVKE